MPRPISAPVEALPLFPSRDDSVLRAYRTFRLRTHHGTLLASAPDAPTLAHEPNPPSGREVVLFRSHHAPGIGLIAASGPLDVYAGSFVGPLLPVLLVEQPEGRRVALRSPIRDSYICALQPEAGATAAGTDFERNWAGPWESFSLEAVAMPPLAGETQAALGDIGRLLERHLEASAVTSWLASSAGRPRDLALQVVVQLLSRNQMVASEAHWLQDRSLDLSLQSRPPSGMPMPVDGEMDPVAEVRPVAGAAPDPRLRGSWSAGPEGRTYASGPRVLIEFDLPSRPACARLRLAIRQSHHPILMTVSLNGWRLARTSIGLHKVHGSCLDYWIPREALASRDLCFAFDFDPPPPQTHGFPYAFELVSCRLDGGPAVAEVGGPEDTAQLMSVFESLGEDCEFGFVQRHFGIEPMGLLRFAGFRGLHSLTRMLETRLEGVGAPGSLSAVDHLAHIDRGLEPPLTIPEYYMTDDRLEFSFHTWKGRQDAPMEDALRDNERKLTYLRRKFLEDLEDCEKIWIFKDTRRQDLNETLAIYDLLNRYGPNRLFWITRSTECRPSGSVEWYGPRLLRGYSGQSANAPRFDPAIWLELCRNAYEAFAGR